MTKPSPDDGLHALLAPYLTQTGGLLQALRAIQAEQGWIADVAVATVADLFNVTHAEVRGVVSFYEDLRETPGGTTIVRICRAEACQAVGARALIRHAEARLGLAMGETDPRRDLTLEAVACLGLCACGPAMIVDGTLHGRVDPAAFDALVP